MHLVQFLLPLRDNDGKPFTQDDLARVRRELTDRFGGVTAFVQSPAAGLWREGPPDTSDSAGGISRDELLLHEVVVPELNRDWWRGYREELERRFRQERILLRAIAVEQL